MSPEPELKDPQTQSAVPSNVVSSEDEARSEMLSEMLSKMSLEMLESAHRLVCDYLRPGVEIHDRVAQLEAWSSEFQRVEAQILESHARGAIDELVSRGLLLSFQELSESIRVARAAIIEGRAERKRAHKRLQASYEACRQRLSAHVGRPVGSPARVMNWQRSLFHMSWGLFAVFLAERFFEPVGLWRIAASFTLVAWLIEGARRLPARWGGDRGRLIYEQIFSEIMHAQEAHHVSSGTWYATSVLLIASLCDETTLILAVLTLAVGDPVAGIIGRRFGRHKLMNNRSLEGSLAFVVSAALSSMILLMYAHPEIQSPLQLALAVGVGGALGELMSGSRLDDNFTVPIGAALGASLVSVLISI